MKKIALALGVLVSVLAFAMPAEAAVFRTVNAFGQVVLVDEFGNTLAAPGFAGGYGVGGFGVSPFVFTNRAFVGFNPFFVGHFGTFVGGPTVVARGVGTNVVVAGRRNVTVVTPRTVVRVRR